MQVSVWSRLTHLVYVLFWWGAFAGFSSSLRPWGSNVAVAILVEDSWGESAPVSFGNVPERGAAGSQGGYLFRFS